MNEQLRKALDEVGGWPLEVSVSKTDLGLLHQRPTKARYRVVIKR